MTELLASRRVSVIRDGKTILEDVSLSIGEKDFITIIGPNGAGKSMLLKCMMGFYAPSEGEVVRRAGLKIGYVPQRLVADHTVPISVRRFLTLRKKAPKAVLQKVAQETGIEEILQQPIHVLSGGELQRVLLARALLDDPDILVLDEPAQNLDVTGQLAFYKLIEKIYAERDVSILMVSHDLHLVMSSTREVVCLFHHICCHGEPNMVTRDPEFISLFGNDMARLMAVYNHSHDHDHTHDHEEEGHFHDHGDAQDHRHDHPRVGESHDG
ncbi:ATP-binding cassette domain-containing protein [Sneathiella litorea]|uniref:ATP-binding cassette domain-containing protein n=1 Tax=Sneathiella litorea TaxID=2606216 RepID=A0A6L8W486_9PROT|nr:ATP-binding cassette domain-containing protein [Sneathiella litorea]MZR29848.1 ATP-binding cassette domain-containing protein [Sneathiella litorea]